MILARFRAQGVAARAPQTDPYVYLIGIQCVATPRDNDNAPHNLSSRRVV
jgi:hypothetical protein